MRHTSITFVVERNDSVGRHGVPVLRVLAIIVSRCPSFRRHTALTASGSEKPVTRSTSSICASLAPGARFACACGTFFSNHAT